MLSYFYEASAQLECVYLQKKYMICVQKMLFLVYFGQCSEYTHNIEVGGATFENVKSANGLLYVVVLS